MGGAIIGVLVVAGIIIAFIVGGAILEWLANNVFGPVFDWMEEHFFLMVILGLLAVGAVLGYWLS